MREKKITRRLWHAFTEGEERACATELSGAVYRAKEARDRKKEVTRAMNEEIGTIEEEIHKPSTGKKQIRRLDGELVAEEAMTPDECQEHLFEAGASA
jgi:hypothetical protein